jgi:DNA-3-methyladenine glycosylase I
MAYSINGRLRVSAAIYQLPAKIHFRLTGFQATMNLCLNPGLSTSLQTYHDHEFGVWLAEPEWLFENLVLAVFGTSIGMSIAVERRHFLRTALEDFNSQRLASLNFEYADDLVMMPGVIKNRNKMLATLHNARLWQDLLASYGGPGLVQWLLDFNGGVPLTNHFRTPAEVPLFTDESTAMSAALKKLGVKLMGPQACYSLMQGAGLVNNHLLACPRHAQLQVDKRA